MVEEGEGGYEIMPYKEIVALKKQIEELQQRTGDTDSKQLLISMANLTKSMNNMLQLFKTAAEEMKLEQKEEEAISKKVEPLVDKVNELMEQNKTIAEGMVAIADMVKDMKGGKGPAEKPRPSFIESLEEPEPSFKPGPMPPPMKPVRFVPPKGAPRPKPGWPMPPSGGDFGPEPFPPPGGFGAEPFPSFEEPFPPPGKPNKKGFLGMFKKK